MLAASSPWSSTSFLTAGLNASASADCATGAGTSADRRVAAYGLFGMMNWIYTWYDPDGSVTPTDLADHFTTLFLHGVADPAAVEGSEEEIDQAFLVAYQTLKRRVEAFLDLDTESIPASQLKSYLDPIGILE